MSDTPLSERRARTKKAMARRRRDFALLQLIFTGVLALLAIAGELQPVVAIMSAVITGAGALAFYAGSAPPEEPMSAARPQSNSSPTPKHLYDKDLLDALPYPALILDDQNRIIGLSPPAHNVFASRSLLGQRLSSIIRSAPLLESVIEARETQTLQEVEAQLVIGGGKTWHVYTMALHSSDNVLILLEDLTAQHQAHQIRVDFLANASHELRTPLTSLSGFIETMRGPAKGDYEAWPRFLDVMHGEAERMSRLIEDLLSLSRIEFSAHSAPHDRVDICTLSRIASEAIQPIAAEQNVTLDEGSCSAGITVIGDPDELSQVFGNLLSNAVKYAGSGGHVRLECGKANSAAQAHALAGKAWDNAERMSLLSAAPNIHNTTKDYVWLRVSDDGPGIAREHLPRIGERFYRTDESRGGKIKGTGLGLAIVKHIMARHRGGLCVETRLGEGSAFGIWLEAAPDASAQSGT